MRGGRHGHGNCHRKSVKSLRKMYIKERMHLSIKTEKAYAIGKRTEEGFLVYKGSLLAQKATKSCPPYVRQLRCLYAEYINTHGVLEKNLQFSSPTAAASFVLYGSVNGQTTWKSKNKIILRDLESPIASL